MTDLGTLIFSAIGLLFVAFVGGMIWLALRGSSPVLPALSRDGWKVEKPDRGPVKWSARRVRNGVAVTVEVTSTGMQEQTVWTSVRMTADTGADDVLVTAKVPGFLAADGALSAAIGFKPPPRWSGGSPAFAAEYDAFASDAFAAARWLSASSQDALLEHSRVHRKVAVRFAEGRIEARWAREPQNPAEVELVVALLDRLGRRMAGRP
jgi:hypothetical protein